MKRVGAIAALMAAAAMNSEAAVRVEKVAWGGWPNCLRISNGEIEMIVTTDVGPRIMRFGFAGGQNFFKEFTAQLGKGGEKEWMARGGHRIWMGPEDVKLTYALDNAPVKAEVGGDGTVTLTQPIEPETGLEKQIIVRMADSGARARIVHRLRNAGKTAREFAPWALTMMAQGGFGVTGFPPRGTHPEQLAPTNPLVMWSFSDLSDPRWKFTKKYLVLQQDPKNTGQPQKLGTFAENTWGAYLLNGEAFIKRYKAVPGRMYPDFGSSYETFTNADMLELETLGPVQNVPPGGFVEHTEDWSLHRNVAVRTWSDSDLDRALLPLL